MCFSHTSLTRNVQSQSYSLIQLSHTSVCFIKGCLVTMLHFKVDTVTTKSHWWIHDNSFAVLFDPRDKATIHHNLITKSGKPGCLG